MKLFVLFISLTMSLFALNINHSLLKVHATLVPKIYLMDYKFKEKLKDHTITVAIVYKNNTYTDAKKLKGLIETRYKDGLKSYTVKPILVDSTNIKKSIANIYYLFPTNQDEIKTVIKQANKNNALTFAYNRDDLKYGVMISLNVSKKIKPLLNLEAIKVNNISLRPVLIDISTIYLNKLETSISNIKLGTLHSAKACRV
ncbi:MAG: YfiR/HmsC family protein [Campylobacterota bacterium]|nr:YfiR/HmsC family protein [Campylobacterota bacterium]